MTVFEITTKGFVGYAEVKRKKVIVNFVRQEECGLFSLYASYDGGRTMRLIPRESIITNESCYYTTADEAMKGAK